MTQVDFYVLAEQQLQARYLFCCRLAEKAWKLGHHVYIHSRDRQQAELIDQLLWSYRPGSFTPHSLSTEATAAGTTGEVEIGYSEEQARHGEVMINLAPQVPGFIGRFDRVSEIVIDLAEVTAETRANYRFYRDRGYPLETHKMQPPR